MANNGGAPRIAPPLSLHGMCMASHWGGATNRERLKPLPVSSASVRTEYGACGCCMHDDSLLLRLQVACANGPVVCDHRRTHASCSACSTQHPPHSDAAHMPTRAWIHTNAAVKKLKPHVAILGYIRSSGLVPPTRRRARQTKEHQPFERPTKSSLVRTQNRGHDLGNTCLSCRARVSKPRHYKVLVWLSGNAHQRNRQRGTRKKGNKTWFASSTLKP